MNVKKLHLPSIATIAISVLSTGLAAQTVSPSAAGQASDGGLEDIIVTAQRQSQSLQRAAVPVEAVTSESLLAAGISDPARLSVLVPGLTATPSSGGIRFYFVRGVGNFTGTALSDPAIAVNYDDVYLGRSTATSGLYFDLERVEVLYGPQGTLYGRNATGGVINIVPARPVAGKLEAYATGTYENYDAFTLEGAVNLPLGPDGALRVSGTVVDRPGYQNDGTYDDKHQSFRAQFGTQLTPDLNVRIGGDYVHLGGAGLGPTLDTVYGFNFATGQYVAQKPGFGKSVGLYDPRAQAFRALLNAGPAGRTLNPLSPYPYQDNNSYGTNADIEWKTGAGTLTFIPAFRYNDIASRGIGPGYTVDLHERDNQASAELRFAGDRIGIFDYSLGGLYFHETQKARYAVNLQAVGIYQGFETHTESEALFGRLTANLNDSLRVTGGARYTHDDKSLTGSTDSLTIVCLATVGGVPTCPTAPLLPFANSLADVALPVPPARNAALPLGATGAIIFRNGRDLAPSLKNSRVTWRGAVEYDVVPSSLLYASVETGYRSGGFSTAFGFETFQPEYITAYTLGAKNRLLDNRLQANVEAFLWKYRDQQLSHFGVDLNGNSDAFTQNIGRSTNKGIDLDLLGQVTPTTQLSAKVQYLDAKYKDFTYLATLGFFPVLTGCPQSVVGATRQVNCSGFQAYNAPKWTVILGAEQRFPVGDYEFVVAGDTQYRTSRYVGFEYLAEQKVGSTWESNARIAFGPVSRNWSIEGFVRNIENNRYSISKFVDTIPNALYSGDAAPRTYGVRGSVRF